MARRTLTDAEREQRAARMSALTDAAHAIETGQPATIDTATATLGNYSRKNIAMILAQCEERGRECPAAVAGFHDWRKAGRTVRKGAKGYAIWRPRMKKDEATGADVRAGFAISYVFDVLDTDPIGENDPDTLRAAMAS